MKINTQVVDTKTKYGNSYWIKLSITAVLVCILGSIIISYLNADGKYVAAGQLAGMLTIASIGAAVTSIIACFKVKSWVKLIPILCTVACISSAFLAYFTYWFSHFGASY